jgi:hypothetical protein
MTTTPERQTRSTARLSPSRHLASQRSAAPAGTVREAHARRGSYASVAGQAPSRISMLGEHRRRSPSRPPKATSPLTSGCPPGAGEHGVLGVGSSGWMRIASDASPKTSRCLARPMRQSRRRSGRPRRARPQRSCVSALGQTATTSFRPHCASTSVSAPAPAGSWCTAVTRSQRRRGSSTVRAITWSWRRARRRGAWRKPGTLAADVGGIPAVMFERVGCADTWSRTSTARLTRNGCTPAPVQRPWETQRRRDRRGARLPACSGSATAGSSSPALASTRSARTPSSRGLE